MCALANSSPSTLSKKVAIEKAQQQMRAAIAILKDHWSSADVQTLAGPLGNVCEAIKMQGWVISRLDYALEAMTPKQTKSKGGAA